ncbi:hypothetical protein SS209_00271 [Salmonella enterica subsp. enterica serovar Senftenberg str. SS209]|nr:hypothetical protein SS209_00271 [Salmonella enterica subsp. enterica serovar Senftenberg str. SS209]
MVRLKRPVLTNCATSSHST